MVSCTNDHICPKITTKLKIDVHDYHLCPHYVRALTIYGSY